MVNSLPVNELMQDDRTGKKTMEQNYTVGFLRGISALWVVIAHCCIWGGYTGYTPNPKVAVDIFMMVSGFLMMFTVDNLHSKEPFSQKQNWLRFYLRRFFRISPGYYASLGVAFLLSSIYVPSYQLLGRLNHNIYRANFSADFSILNMLLHITYVFGVIPQYVSSTLLPDWSLSLEMQFYLIFPVVYLLFKKDLSGLNLIVFGVLIIIFSYISKITVMKNFTEASLIIYQLPFFMIGILIYFASKTKITKLRMVSLFLVAIFCIYAFLYKSRDSVYLAAAAGLLFISATKKIFSFASYGFRFSFLFDTIFKNRFFCFLSDLSFSVYLFHGFVLSILGAWLESTFYQIGISVEITVVILICMVVPITYFIALFSYRYIEKPGIRFGKFVIDRFLPVKDPKNNNSANPISIAGNSGK